MFRHSTEVISIHTSHDLLTSNRQLRFQCMAAAHIIPSIHFRKWMRLVSTLCLISHASSQLRSRHLTYVATLFSLFMLPSCCIKGLGLFYRVRAQRSLSRCLERRGFNLTVWWSRMPESSWNCTGLYLRWVGYCLDIITESNAACVAPQRPSHDHFWIHSFMLPGSPTAISRSSHAFSHCMQGKILRQCLFL